jgi:hypothetical protein
MNNKIKKNETVKKKNKICANCPQTSCLKRTVHDKCWFEVKRDWPVIVAYNCNPDFCEVEYRQITFETSPGKKSLIIQVYIPAVQEE